MVPELETRTWKAIFEDLSFDAAQPYLPMMGLPAPNDLEFARGLRPLVEGSRHMPVTDQAVTNLVDAAFTSARGLGPGYPDRIRDWGVFIYPNSSPLQDQVFRWELIVARGGKDGRRDASPAPEVIQGVRKAWSRRGKVTANQVRPLSEWDLRLIAEREDAGLNPFEWVESAVRNFNFLSAWDAATRGPLTAEQAQQVYQWGLREAEMLRLARDSVGRPEQFLQLPDSLKWT
jgi:hypothetical protein